MNIVFFGTPDFVLPVLETLYKKFSVIGVVTASDTIQGRKKILTPTPVKEYAQTKNIPHILTPQQFNNTTIQQLQSLSPDLFVVAAYGKIIPQAILDIPKFGAINIHPSLLPKYRGPSPIQSTLLHSDRESGVTIIQMDEKMDHGPILTQEKISLKPADTFASLHVELFSLAAKMLPDVIRKFTKGELTPKAQNHDEATFCKLITKEDGYFDSTNPPDPEQLDRMIRAYYPWPTAWTKIKGKVIKFYPEGKLQMEGKKIQEKKEFFNGHPELKDSLEPLLFERDATQ